MTGTLDGVLTDKGLKVLLPSGAGCYYVDKDHSYWRLKEDGDRGTRLTGVTTITKVFDLDPKYLLRWAARTNGIGIAELARDSLAGVAEDGDVERLAWLEDAESIWRELENAKLTFEDIRDAKATVGTNVHELAFQAMALGKAVPDLEKMTDEEQGYAQAVMAFWLDHDPEATFVEQIVVDPELGVAGRLDFFGVLGDCDEAGCPCHDLEGPGVLDAKTGSFLGASAHAQVGGYRHLAELCGLGVAEWGALLKLADNGTYELVVAESAPVDFAVAVAAYRTAGRIKGAAAKAYKARH